MPAPNGCDLVARTWLGCKKRLAHAAVNYVNAMIILNRSDAEAAGKEAANDPSQVGLSPPPRLPWEPWSRAIAAGPEGPPTTARRTTSRWFPASPARSASSLAPVPEIERVRRDWPCGRFRPIRARLRVNVSTRKWRDDRSRARWHC